MSCDHVILWTCVYTDRGNYLLYGAKGFDFVRLIHSVLLYVIFFSCTINAFHFISAIFVNSRLGVIVNNDRKHGRFQRLVSALDGALGQVDGRSNRAILIRNLSNFTHF